jgi:hypothetical protein
MNFRVSAVFHFYELKWQFLVPLIFPLYIPLYNVYIPLYNVYIPLYNVPRMTYVKVEHNSLSIMQSNEHF